MDRKFGILGYFAEEKRTIIFTNEKNSIFASTKSS